MTDSRLVRDFRPEEGTSALVIIRVTAAVVYGIALIGLAFLSDSNDVYYGGSVLGLLAGIVSWVLSIDLWSRRRDDDLLSYLVLLMLVLLGFVLGWLYILLFGRRPVSKLPA